MHTNRPAVTKADTIHQGKFLVFRELHWTDANGVGRTWETADRAATGAVLVVARLLPSDRMVLIRQFRPPAGRMVVEFPAGLADPGETPEAAAARELREETGYTADRLRVFPFAYTSPGLSNEMVYMVLADIDETLPENRDPQTHFDPSEDIQTILVPSASLMDFYLEESTRCAFDAKLAAYILAAVK